MLREQGRRLDAGVRTDDLVARFAGDEFLVLLNSIERREDAERVRANLEEILRKPLEVLSGGETLEVALSAAIGVAIYPEDGQDVDSLIRHADQQMYLHKRMS